MLAGGEGVWEIKALWKEQIHLAFFVTAQEANGGRVGILMSSVFSAHNLTCYSTLHTQARDLISDSPYKKNKTIKYCHVL